MSTTYHWHILGAGAIGSLWAAYWAKDNTPTTAIARSQSSQKQLFLQNNTELFEFSLEQLNASELPALITHLVITTKAQQTEQALASIASHLSDDAIIIVLQNGLAVSTLKSLPKQILIAATTTDGAHFHGTQLNHVGHGITYLGQWPSNTEALSLNQQNELLASLPKGLDIRFCENIEERLWQKLAINCAINALGVKYNCTNGELISNPSIYEELKALCTEISQISKALKLGPWFDNILEHTVEVAELTKDNINSTLQDINAKRKSEISALNGYLVQCAQQQNIDTPINKALVNLVLEKEQQYL